MVAHGKTAGRRRRVWQAAMLTASVWACLAPEPAVATTVGQGRGGAGGKRYHKGSARDEYVRGREMRGSEGAGRVPAGGGGAEAAAPPEARVVVGGGGVGGEGRRLRRRRRTSERRDVNRAELSERAGQKEASRSDRQGRGGRVAGIRPPPSEGSKALADDAARRRGDSSSDEGQHPAPPTNLELLRAGGASGGRASINGGGDSARIGLHGNGVPTTVFAEDVEAAAAAAVVVPPPTAGRRDNGVLLSPLAVVATLEVSEALPHSGTLVANQGESTIRPPSGLEERWQ